MKQTSLILSIIALIASITFGVLSIVNPDKKKTENTDSTSIKIQKGAIVYFNMDRVLNEYDMANDLRTSVETKIKGINDEVTRRGNKLQNEFNSFNDKINKGLLTRSVAEVQGQKLQDQKNSFDEYAAQKQQEILEEQQVMTNQIANAIKTFLEKYNAEKQYAMILSTQGEILSIPVCASDTSFDITDDLIQKLNEEYGKTKSKK